MILNGTQLFSEAKDIMKSKRYVCIGEVLPVFQDSEMR